MYFPALILQFSSYYGHLSFASGPLHSVHNSEQSAVRWFVIRISPTILTPYTSRSLESGQGLQGVCLNIFYFKKNSILYFTLSPATKQHRLKVYSRVKKKTNFRNWYQIKYLFIGYFTTPSVQCKRTHKW